METCNRPTQFIANYEYLGTSLGKINDNFKVLELNACELYNAIRSLSAVANMMKLPETACTTVTRHPCNFIDAMPSADTCVTDTLDTINTNFRNFSILSCALETQITVLSSHVINHPLGKDVDPKLTNKVCGYVLGISSDEYIGDSYSKIVKNFNNLLNEYCNIQDVLQDLQVRICCPKDPEKRQPLLDRFTLQGEGGYDWNSYNFVNRDKLYGTLSYRDNLVNIMTQAEYDKYKYEVVLGGVQYYGLTGVLRACQAANNQSVLCRDGNVYFLGSGGPKMSTWLLNNYTIMQDIFMPSTHGAVCGPTQVVLLTTGDLYFFDLQAVAANSAHIPPIILPNVDRFVCINQAHNADCIVVTKSKLVYHVAVNSTAGSPSPYGVQQITNIGNTDDIEFMQIGDGADSCYVCYKTNPSAVYPINCQFANRVGHDKFGWFTSKNNTPFMTLGAGEYFVDGCSNEFDNVFLTNKRVLCYRNNDNCCANLPLTPANQDCGIPFTAHNLPPGKTAKRLTTSCSYSMTVELSDGYYLLSRRPYSQYTASSEPRAACGGFPAYGFLSNFTIWNTLVQSLSTSRPDIFGVGSTLPCCTCV